MPKSFRLDPALERRLAEAAARRGVAASAFIREAVDRACDEVLGGSLRAELGSLVGSVDIGGDRSSRAGAAFKALLRSKRLQRG